MINVTDPINQDVFHAASPIVLRLGDQLELRERVLEDVDEVFALTDNNRAYLRRWLPWLQFCRSADDTRWNTEDGIRAAEEGRGFTFTIRDQGRIVGVVSYNSVDQSNRTGHIGYWMGQEHQGRGIMTRAVRALVEHGFSYLGLNRIVIAAATGNLKSRAVAERAGFLLEGIAREAEWLYGRVVDHAIYAMTRSDWDARQNISTRSDFADAAPV
jgi:ribosomal-protein-serine acetyltransferase